MIRSVAGGQFSRIEFTVSSSYTRLLLHFCAEAANIGIHSWANCRPSDLDDAADIDSHLVYRLSFKSADDSNVFGAHLVWEMNRCKILNSDEEKSFAKIFRAVSRSA